LIEQNLEAFSVFDYLPIGGTMQPDIHPEIGQYQQKWGIAHMAMSRLQREIIEQIPGSQRHRRRPKSRRQNP
jgi:hypothetical protein